MSIKKRDGKFVVTPKHGGRVLGEHKTKAAALAQIAAIEASKKRRKK